MIEIKRYKHPLERLEDHAQVECYGCAMGWPALCVRRGDHLKVMHEVDGQWLVRCFAGQYRREQAKLLGLKRRGGYDAVR